MDAASKVDAALNILQRTPPEDTEEVSVSSRRSMRKVLRDQTILPINSSDEYLTSMISKICLFAPFTQLLYEMEIK